MSRTRRLRSGTEIRATAAPGMPIWARFPGRPPFTSGRPFDVAWRVGGDHALRLVLIDDAGLETQVERVVPDPSIRWDRPGDAWTSTLEFAHPGCWRIYVTRGANRHGDVWIRIS